MLKDRQKSILEAVITEYISTAKPIASQIIRQKLNLGVSPATVRSEMQELDDLGYIEQPYTSAGRVPTNKGYRFFVDFLVEGGNLSRKEADLLDSIFKVEEEAEFLKEFTRAASRITHAFTIVGMFDNHKHFQTGFSEIMNEPEFQEREVIRNFGKLVDYLDAEIENFFREFRADKDLIFIGDENPIKYARSCSMMLSSWRHPAEYSGFLAIITPKRTNYKKQNELELVPDEENDSSALADKTKDLRERLKTCEQEKGNYLEGWQRAKADFINYRNDEGKRMEDVARFITSGLIHELLIVLDSFELALNHDLAKETERGVLLIKSQLEDILKKRGLAEIQVTAGDELNTEKHESVGEVESDKPAGSVVEVVQKGYLFRDRVIRPVRVRLSK